MHPLSAGWYLCDIDTDSDTDADTATETSDGNEIFTNPPLNLTVLQGAGADIFGRANPQESPKYDIGFTPQCLTHAPPTGQDVQPWWQYSID
ncbi:MAG: hypothetical protein JXX14_13890 [Deltaproteobacteria bacterium]|nr:hypothetical protein [Deltaproteobacteria bacterium]